MIEELINEGCVMATEIMALAQLNVFKSAKMKSMVLFWFESFDTFYIYMLLLSSPNTPFPNQMQPQSIHNSLQTAGVCTTTTTTCCQQTTTLHACELGHRSRVLESAITCCVHAWIRSGHRHCGDKKQSQEWWDWSGHTTQSHTHNIKLFKYNKLMRVTFHPQELLSMLEQPNWLGCAPPSMWLGRVIWLEQFMWKVSQ